MASLLSWYYWLLWPHVFQSLPLYRLGHTYTFPPTASWASFFLQSSIHLFPAVFPVWPCHGAQPVSFTLTSLLHAHMHRYIHVLYSHTVMHTNRTWTSADCTQAYTPNEYTDVHSVTEAHTFICTVHSSPHAHTHTHSYTVTWSSVPQVYRVFLFVFRTAELSSSEEETEGVKNRTAAD